MVLDLLFFIYLVPLYLHFLFYTALYKKDYIVEETNVFSCLLTLDLHVCITSGTWLASWRWSLRMPQRTDWWGKFTKSWAIQRRRLPPTNSPWSWTTVRRTFFSQVSKSFGLKLQWSYGITLYLPCAISSQIPSKICCLNFAQIIYRVLFLCKRNKNWLTCV